MYGLTDDIIALAKERNALLAACKKARQRIREMGCDPETNKIVAMLDKVIKKATNP